MADRENAEEATGAATDAAQRGIEAARRIAAELIDASRAAAQSLADEQKHRAAQQVANIAEAIEQAAQSLDRSDNRAAAAYTRQAAESIEQLSRAIDDRSWADIGADVEGFARRQPVLFALGAVGAGFLAGRFLLAPAPAPPADRHSEADAEEVLAVESATGRTTGEADTAEPAGEGGGSGADVSSAAGLSGAKGSS